jgi:hypothetical protein
LSSKNRRPRGNPARQTPKNPTQQRRPAGAARRSPATGPGRAGQQRRPVPPGESPRSRAAGPLRRAVERRSAPLLIVMHQLPRWLTPLLMAALFLVGVIVAGVVGLVALALLLAFLVWLSYLSWPVVDARGRTIRLLLLGVLTALIVLQGLGV